MRVRCHATATAIPSAASVISSTARARRRGLVARAGDGLLARIRNADRGSPWSARRRGAGPDSPSGDTGRAPPVRTRTAITPSAACRYALQLRSERAGQLALVVRSEDVEEIGDRLVDDARARAPAPALPRSSPARISSTASSSRSSAPASLEVTAVTDSLCCTVSVTTPLRRDSAKNVHTLAITVVSTSRPAATTNRRRRRPGIMSRSRQSVSLALPLQRRRVDVQHARRGFQRGRLRHDARDVFAFQRSSDTGAPTRTAWVTASGSDDELTPRPRSAGSSTSRDARMTARSTALRSSRRFPGQRCASIACSAAGENRQAGRRCFRPKMDR